MKKWKISLCAGTHWDKEWFFSKQVVDVYNFFCVNQLIKNELKNPYPFMYDGLSSFLDDYVQFRPSLQQLNDLTKLMQEGKIIAGPFYTQMDYFNCTSESIIRNILLGIETCKKFNSPYQKVAYVSDPFGVINQLPQIYQGFNLNNSIYWRGARDSDVKNSCFNWWEGLDGTKIKTYNLSTAGYYTPGGSFMGLNLTESNLTEKAEYFLLKFKDELKILKKSSPNINNNLPLPLTVDMNPSVYLTPQFVKKLNEIDEENDWVLSSLDTWYKEMENNIPSDIVKGEFRASSFGRVHKSCASHRVDIKSALKKLEYEVYNVLEPLATYLFVQTNTYPSEIIAKIFRLLESCIGHDSIVGANSDKTNADVLNRITQANDYCDALITHLFKKINSVINLLEDEFFIFNPTLFKKNFAKEVVIFSKWKNINILNQENQKIDFNIIETMEIKRTNSFYKHVINLYNLNIDPMHISVFKVEKEDKNLVSKKIIDIIENDYWKIDINKNGTLNLFNKKLQKNFKNQFKIFAVIDNGDAFDFSPNPENLNIISNLINTYHTIVSSGNDNLQQIILVNSYKITNSLNDKTYCQTFTLKFNIENSNFIDIKINTKNIAPDIRWRIETTTDFLTNYSVANQCYGNVERPIELVEDFKVWQKNHWKEKPVAVETNESFVYLNDNFINQGFITKGNNEYECFNANNGNGIDLHLTLYRAISFFGRADLINRPGRASGIKGWALYDSRFILKELNFEIKWFATNKEDTIWKIADELNTSTVYYQNQKHVPYFRDSNEWMLVMNDLESLDKEFPIIIDNPNFVVKSIKKAEEVAGIIIRGLNPTKEVLNINFKILNNDYVINKVNLLEEKIDENITSDSVGPWKIRTYLVIKK